MPDRVTPAVRARNRQQWWDEHDHESYTCPDCGRGLDHPLVDEFVVHHVDNDPDCPLAVCMMCHQVREGATRRSVDLDQWKAEFRALGDDASDSAGEAG